MLIPDDELQAAIAANPEARETHARTLEASLIEDAIAMLASDAGAVFKPDVLEQLRITRENDPAQWARYRQAIKTSGMVSMSDLDRLTTSTPQVNASEEIFPPIEPWPNSVNGSALLDDIAESIRRHVIADQPTIHAATLWIAFTWFVDVVNVAPIANITAPEKRCGKTVMLGVLARLSRRPLTVSNIAPAALFRSLELWSPTLLIDEVDAFLSEHEEARGILNAGFTRDSAFVIRCTGDDHTPTRFNVWGAKALCGIGKIADTLIDRSIPLRLRRKLPGEEATKIRHADAAAFVELSRKLARFSLDHFESVRSARPAEIEGLGDRANDCWEPLLSIAEIAGGHWPDCARKAAKKLHDTGDEPVSIGAELLADVKAAFERKRVVRLSSVELLEALCEDDEAPWAAWNRGKPITARQLSTRLKEYGAKPTPIRFSYGVAKGYQLEHFHDAFGRYLSPATPSQSVTELQANNHAGFGVTDSNHVTVTHFSSVTRSPSNDAGCNRVTDTAPQSRKGKDDPTASCEGFI